MTTPVKKAHTTMQGHRHTLTFTKLVITLVANLAISCVTLANVQSDQPRLSLFAEAPFNAATTKNEAEQQLNKAMFNKNLPTIVSVSQTVTDIDQRLGTHIKAGFSFIEPIRKATYDLGLQAACAEHCEDSAALIQQLNRRVNRDAGTAVVLLPTSNSSQSVSLLDDLITPNCSDSASPKCTNATLLAIDLWRIAGLYRSFANHLNTRDKQTSLKKLAELDQQWLSYKNDTIKLWPQEVLLSSLLFKQNHHGFTAPPNYKLLTLRPHLALSYLSDGSPDIQPTLNVDLLGVYWWQYQGSKANKGQGLAASLVWTGDDTAYGVTYHHGPKWSATLASSDEQDVIFSVSFQLGYWLLK